MAMNYSPERLALIREVEDFVYLEAELADAHRFDEWFALWSNELLYWVPCNDDELDTNKHVSLIYDNYERLEERLFRLKTKHAHSQSPRSKLSHSITNVRLDDGFDRLTGGTVVSRFIVCENRMDKVTTWAGQQKHMLVRDGESLRIKEKHLLLINNDSPMGNLTFII